MQRLYLSSILTILRRAGGVRRRGGAAVVVRRRRRPHAAISRRRRRSHGALLPDADAPVAEQRKAVEELHRQLQLRSRPLPAQRRHDRHGRQAAAALRRGARAHRLATQSGWARTSPCSCLTGAGWSPARSVNGPARPSGSRLSWCWWHSLSRSAPTPWCVGSAGGSTAEGRCRRFGNNLGARVKVEGHDEVAALAASFNRSAQRIEELVAAHRLLLANSAMSCARRSPASPSPRRC